MGRKCLAFAECRKEEKGGEDEEENEKRMKEGPSFVETWEMESGRCQRFSALFIYSPRSLDIQCSKIKPIRVSKNSSSSSSDMVDPAATIHP